MTVLPVWLLVRRPWKRLYFLLKRGLPGIEGFSGSDKCILQGLVLRNQAALRKQYFLQACNFRILVSNLSLAVGQLCICFI